MLDGCRRTHASIDFLPIVGLLTICLCKMRLAGNTRESTEPQCENIPHPPSPHIVMDMRFSSSIIARTDVHHAGRKTVLEGQNALLQSASTRDSIPISLGIAEESDKVPTTISRAESQGSERGCLKATCSVRWGSYCDQVGLQDREPLPMPGLNMRRESGDGDWKTCDFSL